MMFVGLFVQVRSCLSAFVYACFFASPLCLLSLLVCSLCMFFSLLLFNCVRVGLLFKRFACLVVIFAFVMFAPSCLGVAGFVWCRLVVFVVCCCFYFAMFYDLFCFYLGVFVCFDVLGFVYLFLFKLAFIVVCFC